MIGLKTSAVLRERKRRPSHGVKRIFAEVPTKPAIWSSARTGEMTASFPPKSKKPFGRAFCPVDVSFAGSG